MSLQPGRDCGVTYGAFLHSFCRFCCHKTIVEIGVQHGNTTDTLCDAARATGGKVFGYDFFGPIGVYPAGSCSSKEDVEEKLTKKFGEIVKLTKVDTQSDEFADILREDTKGKIDFAFIDGDHSYNGIKNDFLKVYPLLTEEGAIAFHDTYSHAGCRKFVIELYTTYNDGTFDIINLPYGWCNEFPRMGLTLLVKRSYPAHADGICGSHDKDLKYQDVYDQEKEWYHKQLKA